MTNRSKPRRLPVYAELTDEPIPENSPEPYPVQTKTESWFNFWLLVMVAIIAAGSLGWMWGWFRTPSQALTDQNEKLTQQLAAQSAELDRIKTCIDK